MNICSEIVFGSVDVISPKSFQCVDELRNNTVIWIKGEELKSKVVGGGWNELVL